MKLKLKFSEEKPFRIGFSEINLLPGGGGGDPYEGNYAVTPSFSEQIMQTKNKTMLQNMNIHAIPVSETDNAAGGVTLSI